MSSGEELQTIFSRIKSRVKGGSANYNTLLKLVTARADAEERYGASLKAIGDDKSIDADDPLLGLFVTNIRTEGDLRLKYAAELRKGVCEKLRTFGKTMDDNQKKYLATLKRDGGQLKKACEELDKAKKELERQERELQQCPQNKRDAQQKKVDKSRQDVAAKMQKADKLAVQIQQSSMPNLHTGFSGFDSQRMTVMQSGVKEYARILKEGSGESGRELMSLMDRVDGFDGKGRSQRFVSKVFDVKDGDTREIKENETPMAVAIADYRSEEDSDLQFMRGDRITVLSQHSSGWWVGQLGERTGTFPSTYVDMGVKAQYNDPIGAVFLVKNDFPAGQPGTIELFTGDLVFVDYLKGDKCSGTNMRTKKRGYFPLACLEISMSDTPVVNQPQPRQGQQGPPPQRPGSQGPQGPQRPGAPGPQRPGPGQPQRPGPGQPQRK